MASKSNKKPNWGLLPEDVKSILKSRYWQNRSRLKKLLLGGEEFPISLPLKPPRGNTALDNINHFQMFISSWKAFPASQIGQTDVVSEKCSNDAQNKIRVLWREQNFRVFSQQQIPTHIQIPDIVSLAHLLGEDEEHQLSGWQSKIAFVINSLATNANSQSSHSQHSEHKKSLFDALVDSLNSLEKLSNSELELLVAVIPQLRKGLGKGCYLRELPITYVDTKFVEKNKQIIESIAAAIIDRTVNTVGLLHWLQCEEKPKDWLLVKPLCPISRESLGGVPLLRISCDTLTNFELPAMNILVVENEQSCLSLGQFRNTIAISGGGKNVEFLSATWLENKNVGYWGDIDSEGLKILSDARSQFGGLTPLMMDEKTVLAFEERMVPEPESVFKVPCSLTVDESTLFNNLRSKKYKDSRLEQERLPRDHVATVLNGWLEGKLTTE